MPKNAIQALVPISDEIIDSISSLITDESVTEVTYKINKKKGIINISGKKDNEVFQSTKQIYGDNGCLQSVSRFNSTIARSERKQIVLSMREDGLKQQEIANILGISQSQVSNIVNSKGSHS